MITHFLCKGTLHGFLVTLKSVNSAIFAFWSKEHETLFDHLCGIKF